jgi:hypothetical protein
MQFLTLQVKESQSRQETTLEVPCEETQTQGKWNESREADVCYPQHCLEPIRTVLGSSFIFGDRDRCKEA